MYCLSRPQKLDRLGPPPHSSLVPPHARRIALFQALDGVRQLGTLPLGFHVREGVEVRLE
jgi:hypothetical protein